MAYTTIVTGTTITSSWANTAVRDQVVTPFASSAARTSAISSPVNGMLSTLTPADATNGIYHYNGTAWRPPWNLPWGLVAIATRATDFTSILTTEIDITSLSVTWTAVANRYYRTRLYLPWVQQVTATGGITLKITDGSNVQKQRADVGPLASSSTAGPQILEIIETLSAGSATRKGRGNSSAGGVFLYGNTSGSPMHILVEDLGPAGAPA